MKTTITPEAIAVAREKCHCVKSIDPNYDFERDDPDFESCLDYWRIENLSDWCDGCEGAVEIIVKAKTP